MFAVERLCVTRTVFSRRDRDEKGAAMAEYGLLVAFIAAVAVAGVQALGGNVADLFETVVF